MTSISELIDPYVEARQAKRKFSGTTPATARAFLGRFADWAGDPDVSAVDERMVDAYLTRRPCAPNTMRTELTQLRGLFKWCWRMRLVDEDPTARLEGPRCERGVPRALSVDETRDLVGVLRSDVDRRIAILAVQMGLRRIELAGATVGDVDEVGRRLHVTRKGGKRQWLPVPAEAWELIRPLLGQPAETRLVPRSKSQISRVIARAMRDAGLEGEGRSMHALRHSFAQHTLDAGAPIRDVQHLMGHASQVTTSLYDRVESATAEQTIEGRRYGS